MDEKDTEYFFQTIPRTEQYLSYCDKDKNQEIIINFSQSKLEADIKNHHSKQNIRFFTGYIKKCIINSEETTELPSELVFPARSFRKMLFNHFITEEKVRKLFLENAFYKIIFRKKNSSNYKIVNVEKIMEKKQNGSKNGL